MAHGETEWVQVTTADGEVLDGDLALAATPRAGVVLCHPHPQYGGSRFDRVISALTEALPTHGYDALRFDFRRRYGAGIDERLDAVGALDVLAERRPGSPLHLVGYSFGAMVAMGVHDDRIASHVLIAPPLVGEYAAIAPPVGPTLLLVPEHDQFCPPGTAAAAIASWPPPVAERDVTTVTMADHFLAGRVDTVVEAIVGWLDAR